jgi:hypothetical protein
MPAKSKKNTQPINIVFNGKSYIIKKTKSFYLNSYFMLFFTLRRITTTIKFNGIRK